MSEPPVKSQSWFSKLFGRSFMSMIFGRFFENKNNTASLLAIILVITLCWVVITKEKYDFLNGILNIVFVIIGYYFGAKQSAVSEEENE
jgi:hypothetical protein